MGQVVEKHLFTERVDEIKLDLRRKDFSIYDLPCNDLDGKKGTLEHFS